MPQQEFDAIARKPPSAPTDPTAKPPRPRAAPRARVAALATPPGTPRKKAVVAGPKAPRAPAARKKLPSSRLEEIQKIIVASLEDDKAERVAVIDLEGRATFADRMVIATGLADRQISAMATHLEDKLEEAGLKRIQIEGSNGSDWVLIDAGDIVIHLFKPEAREMYGLERMWGTDLDDQPEAAPAEPDVPG